MSNWGLQSGAQDERIGFNLSGASTGLTIGSLPAANTWTAYAELVAATAHDAHGFNVQLIAGASAGRTSVVEIAVGTAGNEVAVFGPFSINTSTSIGYDAPSIFVPIAIPAGSRLSVRWRSSATVSGALFTPRVTVTLLAAGWMTPVGLASDMQAYGLTLDASTTESTALDAGATLNSEGAHVEVAASTARRARGFYVNLSVPPSSGWRNDYVVHVSLGSIGTETRIASVHCRTDTAGQMTPRIAGPFFFDLPAGSRLTMSAQSNTAVAGNRVVGGWLLLF